MNYPAVLGITVTVAVLCMGIMLGSPLVIFFDVPSLSIVVLGTVFITLGTHGTAGCAALGKGVGRIIFPARTTQAEWGVSACQTVVQVARTAGTSAILLAGCGAMIGLTQMLHGLDDPSQLGPAMAMAMLTSFYGILLNLLIFIPLTRYFTEAALDGEATV
jgi:flagellar motor component MotA